MGLPIPGQNLWQALLGIDHRQHNTPIDALTQAHPSMHNREIKIGGTTGTSQTLRHKTYSSTLIIEKDSKRQPEVTDPTVQHAEAN